MTNNITHTMHVIVDSALLRLRSRSRQMPIIRDGVVHDPTERPIVLEEPVDLYQRKLKSHRHGSIRSLPVAKRRTNVSRFGVGSFWHILYCRLWILLVVQLGKRILRVTWTFEARNSATWSAGQQLIETILIYKNFISPFSFDFRWK